MGFGAGGRLKVGQLKVYTHQHNILDPVERHLEYLPLI